MADPRRTAVLGVLATAPSLPNARVLDLQTGSPRRPPRLVERERHARSRWTRHFDRPPAARHAGRIKSFCVLTDTRREDGQTVDDYPTHSSEPPTTRAEPARASRVQAPTTAVAVPDSAVLSMEAFEAELWPAIVKEIKRSDSASEGEAVARLMAECGQLLSRAEAQELLARRRERLLNAFHDHVASYYTQRLADAQTATTTTTSTTAVTTTTTTTSTTTNKAVMMPPTVTGNNRAKAAKRAPRLKPAAGPRQGLSDPRYSAFEVIDLILTRPEQVLAQEGHYLQLAARQPDSGLALRLLHAQGVALYPFEWSSARGWLPSESPFLAAIQSGHIDNLQCLLELGAQPDASLLDLLPKLPQAVQAAFKAHGYRAR